MRAIIILIVILAVGFGVYTYMEDRNDTPLENMAEEVEDSAEDIADELEN